MSRILEATGPMSCDDLAAEYYSRGEVRIRYGFLGPVIRKLVAIRALGRDGEGLVTGEMDLHRVSLLKKMSASEDCFFGRPPD